MADERVWLRHPETGGAFFCPAEAADDWRAEGWADGDAPAEFNPVVAHLQTPEPEPAPPAEGTKSKSGRRAASTEGSD